MTTPQTLRFMDSSPTDRRIGHPCLEMAYNFAY